jgi:hypothetical protein
LKTGILDGPQIGFLSFRIGLRKMLKDVHAVQGAEGEGFSLVGDLEGPRFGSQETAANGTTF